MKFFSYEFFFIFKILNAIYYLFFIFCSFGFQYLALYSPVFHALFFSKFSERDKKEITVEDVILDEFIELLNVVYPSHKPVTGEIFS